MRFGTIPVGTMTYKVAGMMMSILDEEFPAHYEFFAFPFPVSTVAMKNCMHGGSELAFATSVGMRQVHARTGAFTGLTPRKAELVHTFYMFPVDTILAIHARDAHLYRSWADLSGLPTFFGPAGGATYVDLKRAYHALGYDFRHTEMGYAAVPDVLEAGAIEATMLWVVAETALPPWVMEVDLKTDITIINPTPAERAKMTAAGIPMARVGPDVFTQDVGVPEIWGIRFVSGFNTRPDISQEFVYNMLTAFYRRRADLYRFERSLGPLYRDFVGLQVTGISATPEVPVHPGLHQFLVEKGAWNPAWTVAKPI
jgi:TRAP-type uncharacterized transport system substrate-binding protein